MKCPTCTHQNPSEFKYCGECGQRMGAYCAICHAVNLPESFFCCQCGRSLSNPQEGVSKEEFSVSCSPTGKKVGPSTVKAERKYATVLFSDLSGYTRLAQRLDPEEVKEMMARFFQDIQKIVAKYEGFVEKYVGDAVMVVFGAVRAYEDDPIRAIQAAREIHEMAAALSADYGTTIGQRLEMHSGINTGLVVTGDVDFVKGTHAIAGAAMNLAARLCSRAKSGEILVGPETYRHAIGHFHFEALEPAHLKGMAAPVQIYRVLSRIEQPQKIHRFHGLRSELVGRSPELELLKEALNRLRIGKGSLVLLCGNAGTGKSRMVEECKSFLNSEKINWLEGQCFPYTGNFTYFPFIDLLNRKFGIREGDPPEIVRDKIDSNLSFVENKDEVVPYVGSLYNFKYKQTEGASPEVRRLRLQSAVLEILREMGKRAQTVFCLEDLHWADPSSLELIRFLLADFRYPAMVICVYRPTLSLLSGQEIARLRESVFEIRLEDLSPAETDTMLRSLLKTETIPAELKRFVREKAGGNPFYIEEIINSFVDSEVLVAKEAEWSLHKALADSKISSTIRALIAARIDRLEYDMKRLLQEAAVIGRSFCHDILSRITEFEDRLWPHLSSLQSLDLIKVRSYTPSMEYVFKHALTQEVVYSGLVKKSREAIHEHVGLVMEKLFADRLPEYYEALAYHFQRGRSVQKAVDYLLKSGQKSMERYALEEAHQHYQDAFVILSRRIGRPSTDQGLLIDLLNQWAFVYYYRGRYNELLSILTHHRTVADSLPHSDKLGMFYAWLGCALWHRESFKKARQHLMTALEMGEETGNPSVVGHACSWLSWVCTELGRIDNAIRYARRAQQLVQENIKDDFIYVISMSGMGYAYWHRGDKAKTLEIGNELLDFGKRRDDRRAKCRGYCCIGWSYLIGNDLDRAIPFFEKAVQVSVDPWYALFPKFALSYGLIRSGKILEAEIHIHEIRKFSRKFGAEFAGTPSHFFYGMVLVNRGHIKQGLEILEESCRSWKQNDKRLRYAACGTMLAKVYADLAVKARARHLMKFALLARQKADTYFQNSIEKAEQIRAHAILGQAYLDWGRLSEEQGDSQKAAECLEKSARWFRVCGSKNFSQGSLMKS